MSRSRRSTGAVLLCLLLLPASAWAQVPPEVIEYYAFDAIGSVRVVFDVNGAIVGRMDYTPFGQELTGGTGLPQQRFAGLFRDGEAGLDHAQARSYQVRTGRFSTVDPLFAGLFEPQAWNRYSYAVNSPTVFTDGSGLNAESGLRAPCENPAARQEFHCTFFEMLRDLNLLGGGGAGFEREPRQGRGVNKRAPSDTPPQPPDDPVTEPPIVVDGCNPMDPASCAPETGIHRRS